MSNLIGHSLGRYQILEPLGEGGMAIVYKAYDTRLESEVAVKVIRIERLAPEILQRAMKRFEREAKSLAQLTHPNLVKVLDYGEYEGQPYLVMPYLPGGTLKQKMNGQPMPWQDAARLLIPIARALDYAHKRNLIHRDVKPSNILITESGEPMLTDFGVAKIIDEEATLDLTGTSAAVGTPEYMAPEQATSKNIDHRADIYALGIVFYEMVTGRRPFQADTPLAVLFKQASEPLPRPTLFIPSLPDGVEKILLKALAKRPEDRYQSIGDLASSLDGLLVGTIQQPTESKKTMNIGQIPSSNKESKESPPQTVSKPGNRGFWLVLVGLGVGLIAVCLFIGWLAVRKSVILLSGSSVPTATASRTPVPVPSFTSTAMIPPSPTTTPMPTPFGGGGQIIFHSDRDGIGEIYLVHPDGSGLSRLTSHTDRLWSWYPTWAPDGQRIAFTCAQSGNHDICVANADGSNVVNITNNSAGDSRQAWSPDGRKIAFESNRNGNWEIFVMNADGSDLTRLTNNPAYNNQTPAWSPDGHKIAFSSLRDGDWDIYVMNSDGSEAINLTSNSYNDYHPAWSPNGQKIAYYSNRGNNKNEIIVMNADGSSEVNLTSNSADDAHPVWSADGRLIAFQSDRGGNSDIYVMKADGSDVTQITNNSAYDGEPAWYWPQ